ncbi:MAG TPA: anhydro-N-acetylmuramic acid kinase [Bacteroidia bacterium]|nr:anhydro-N-acetylmuramic acid kinase [Bacteroidia bacterium]HRH07995.1 anhydro-N-acetylmuramic acid kinase [Bacteroidia bacterium]
MQLSYRVVGAMSGTSLDGLDLAYCKFIQKGSNWKFTLLASETIAYTKAFKRKLAEIDTGSALDFVKMDHAFGVFTGKKIASFVRRNKILVDFVSSHGHTIFHQPTMGITTQIGNGAAIAAETGFTTVCDFRRLDVAMHGQGAPLVPIGDRYLFGTYDYCLNLGGFANVSFEYHGKRIAYDICPVNIVLNKLVAERGLSFDRNGALGRKGNVNSKLVKELNQLSYYNRPFPKSLGKEWVFDHVLPLLDSYQISLEDKLASIYKHIAEQITKSLGVIRGKKLAKVLVTGGGAYNDYLMECIRKKTSLEIVVPAPQIIEFKEAIIFAFLGVLRIREQKNCLQSVTGADADSIGGCVYVR